MTILFPEYAYTAIVIADVVFSTGSLSLVTASFSNYTYSYISVVTTVTDLLSKEKMK